MALYRWNPRDFAPEGLAAIGFDSARGVYIYSPETIRRQALIGNIVNHALYITRKLAGAQIQGGLNVVNYASDYVRQFPQAADYSNLDQWSCPNPGGAGCETFKRAVVYGNTPPGYDPFQQQAELAKKFPGLFATEAQLKQFAPQLAEITKRIRELGFVPLFLGAPPPREIARPGAPVEAGVIPLPEYGTEPSAPDVFPAVSRLPPSGLAAVEPAPAGPPPQTFEVVSRFAPIVPVPIGGIPVLGPILVISGIILSVLFKIFGGGVPSQVKRALEGLREAIQKSHDLNMRFAWSIGRAFGWLVQAVNNLWVRVLRPIIEHVQDIFQRAARIIDRVLKPYWDQINRIRRTILDLYNRYARPIIDAIQRVRQMLYLLRLFHLKFAERLDAQLARLQGRIAAPFLRLLRMTNELGGWINVLLTAKLILQRPIFTNTMDAYAGVWIRQFYNAQSRPLSDAERRRIGGDAARVPVSRTTENFRAHMLYGGGEYAARIARAGLVFRSGARS